MTRLFSLLILSLSLALLPGVPRAVAQVDMAAPPGSGYTVRGTVVNAVTNQPVARALVALNQDQAMLTDSSGQFSFDNVAAGGYIVSVNKPGFQGRGGFFSGRVMRAGRGAPPRPEPPLPVQVGPDMPALTLRVTPLAMITGHVTLSTADPADGINVQAFVRQLQNGHPRWVVAAQARTRSDGSFRIAGLSPGSYRIATLASLDRPGMSLRGKAPLRGYPSLYYPGVTEINAAGVLNLGAGQQAEADLTLVRQQFFPVVALVHSSAEMPANFQILDSAGRPTGLSANFNRQEGVVRAAVPNGTWTLDAHAYGPTQEWGSTTFQVNGAPVSLAISLVPIPHIPVVIRRDFVAAADGSQPPSPGPGMNLNLVNDDMGQAQGWMNHTGNDSDTGWEINVTQPGRYWVHAQAYPPAYVSSVSSGGVDLGSNPLVIVPGSTPPTVEVTLRNDGGSISGQIAGQPPGGTTGPRPPAGQRTQTWVYAIPLFATPAEVPQSFVQQNDEFTIPNVAPGSYRVVACDAPQEIDFHSAEGLAAWAGKGQVVSVDPGGTASVSLDVIHATPETEVAAP